MVKAKKFVYARRFDGEPKLDNFNLVEEELAELQDDDVLIEALYLSVDPYMRAYVQRLSPGQTMIGSQVARVVESKSKDFPIGAHVWAHLGWRNKSIFNLKTYENDKTSLPPYVLPAYGELPLSLGIGTLGMPGNTAYFGFLEICQPKVGETVAVTGAAGAVGMIVGQIAKIKGCKVIGFAGTDEKCEWLKTELAFDHVINYKSENVKKQIVAAAPNGIDCYFDNVGGELSTTIISQMNTYGRVSVCGSISAYNSMNENSELPTATILQPAIVFKQLKIEGFIVYRWLDRWLEGLTQLQKWIGEGKLKYHETITDGFENMPHAFIGLLRGENTGKAVVKA